MALVREEVALALADAKIIVVLLFVFLHRSMGFQWYSKKLLLRFLKKQPTVSYSQPQAEKIKIPSLPLAVYREIAAHLQQLDGLDVEIIPQSSSEFSYLKSQVEGLLLRYSSHFSPEEKQRCQEILAYYEKCHGRWERTLEQPELRS